MTPFTIPRCLAVLWLRARLVGPTRGGADGDVPVHRKALWDLGPETDEVVGGEVGTTVCVLVVSNSRALFPPPGKRRGGETAAAAAAAVVTSDTLLSPLRRTGSSFPSLSLFVVCLMC